MVDKKAIEKAIRDILYAIGEDPNREGLAGTPDRVARFYEEFYNWESGNTLTSFEQVQVDQMIVVRNIMGYSMCEHHMLPFSFTAHVGYLPKLKGGRLKRFIKPNKYALTSKVLGLSKIARIVQKHAHKLQIQERMAHDVAYEVQAVTHAMGVGVVIEGSHLCTSMRGIRQSNLLLDTSALLGIFREDRVKSEFLTLALKRNTICS